MKKNIIFSILVILFTNSYMFSQKADVTRGCSPLDVHFISNNLSNYYWDFVEGNATSIEKNPNHIFTHPGVYNVILSEGKGGKKIGEIKITVYEDPIVNFEADTTSGCTPLTVSFTSDVSLDPAIKILGYNWAFGDGEQSSEKNPIHIYTREGEFKVSLEIKTDIAQCDVTYNIEKYIKINQLNINFIPNVNFICGNSGTIKFNNITPKESGNTYHWDFGNGKTSSEYNPDSVFYSKKGEYIVRLEVTTPEGCVFTKQKNIRVNKPDIDLVYKDTACYYQSKDDFPGFPQYPKEFFQIINKTIADSFYWKVDSPNYISNSIIDDTFTVVSFKQEGYNSVYLRAYDKNHQCFSDTTISLYVEKPNPRFTFDPIISCKDPVTINFKAEDTTLAKYTLTLKHTNVAISTEDPYGSVEYDIPEGDSLYWHLENSLKLQLEVLSKNGCPAIDLHTITSVEPNAHFIPDVAQGCAPLTVTFEDKSESYDSIVKWKYTYGTGDSIILFSNDDNHQYIFDEPGDYYVKQFIETEAGCLDTSAGEWIKVGEPIAPDYEIDKTEICLGDSINILIKNDDSRIDAVHVYTDDDRFNHCWNNKNPSHVFSALPGEYPVVVTTEYNGCYVYDTAAYKIKVNGAKADLGYSIDCANPNTVHLIDRSINSGKLVWVVDGDTVLDKTSFDKYFDETGIYTAKIEAIDTANGCSSTFDSIDFQITNVKANFEAPKKICDNELFYLDASKSVDVNNGCEQGFTWYIPTIPRPLRTFEDSIQLTFPRGDNLVKLIVEDINGCKDTIEKHVRSYGIDLDIKLDKDTICVPTTVQVINNSSSDTTLFYTWQNGSNEKEPLFIYDKSYIDNHTNVKLKVKDAFGCTDFFYQRLVIYRPKANIFFYPGNNVCVGDELTFSASEFSEQGAKLNYKWNLEGVDTFDQRNNTVVFEKSGLYPLYLHFTEEESGCPGDSSTLINVVDIPVASFYSDADKVSPLCYPRIIQFNDSSKIDGSGYIRWFIEGVTLSNSTSKTQVIEFPKGEHTATLVARSIYGCADTISKSFVVVGPEGKVISDKFSICIGDTIGFELIDQVDVNSFKWDFGDGTTIVDENPIKHRFDRSIDTTDAKIILKSTDNCEVSIDIPLLVNEVKADFEKYDTSVFCSGYAYLNNLSIGANKFTWNVGEGEIKDSGNPLFVVYPSSGSYDITLKVINTSNNCTDEITKTITLEQFNATFVIPNIFTPNGDGENDTFGPVIINKDFKGFIKFKVFKIYNRWGNLVYDNTNADTGWDGTFEGKEAPAGIYGYHLEADINGCETIIKQGNISLIR